MLMCSAAPALPAPLLFLLPQYYSVCDCSTRLFRLLFELLWRDFFKVFATHSTEHTHWGPLGGAGWCCVYVRHVCSCSVFAVVSRPLRWCTQCVPSVCAKRVCQACVQAVPVYPIHPWIQAHTVHTIMYVCRPQFLPLRVGTAIFRLTGTSTPPPGRGRVWLYGLALSSPTILLTCPLLLLPAVCCCFAFRLAVVFDVSAAP